MKNKSYIIPIVLIATGALLVANGCSSMPGHSESGKEISANGPTILNAHAEPSTVELNRNLQPMQAPEIIADVKDFNSKISNVQLKFTHVPIQVPMENVGGTTWRAQISPQQLKTLAVSGKTISYDANVVARNEQGQTSTSSSPITLSIKAPDMTRAS
jgi:hypothetical protein